MTRFLATEGGFYQLNVEYPSILHAELRRDIERFVESFTLEHSGEPARANQRAR